MTRLVIIGAGKLASQLAPALANTPGVHLLQIYNRNLQKAKELGLKCSCDYSNKLRDIPTDADLYILAVSDGAIGLLASQLKGVLPNQALVAHTSGATPSTIFSGHFARFGVFYPLQTFSKSKEADFQDIPILLDASREDDLKYLEALATKISKKVYRITDEERARVHIAAVFACNFSNHNYAIANKLLKEKGLVFDLIRPLILETARLVQQFNPEEVQTGPAIRNDQPTLDRHLGDLENWPEWKALYERITADIQKANEQE